MSAEIDPAIPPPSKEATIEALLDDRSDLRRRVEGLERYVEHATCCGSRFALRGPTLLGTTEFRPCNCGLDALLADTPAPRPDPRDARIAELEMEISSLRRDLDVAKEWAGSAITRREAVERERDEARRALSDAQQGIAWHPFVHAERERMGRELAAVTAQRDEARQSLQNAHDNHEAEMAKVREECDLVTRERDEARDELARYREANRQPLQDAHEARMEVARLRTALREALAGLRAMIKRAEGALAEQAPPDGWVPIADRGERRYDDDTRGIITAGDAEVAWALYRRQQGRLTLQECDAVEIHGSVLDALAEAQAACDAAAGRASP